MLAQRRALMATCLPRVLWSGQWRERLHGICRGYGLCGAEGCCACVVLVHGLRHAAIAVGLFGNVLVEAAGAIAVGINGHVGEP